MKGCLDDEQVAALVDGQLDREAARRAAEHLDRCDSCRRVVAAAAPMHADPSDAHDPPLAAGAQLGRFVVQRRLGQGGMGAVYAARDPALGRDVALKLVRPDLRDERLEARLRREAQALARLNHPEVVTVYEVGLADGRLFIAMELLEGGTLRDWLGAAERPWREIVQRFVRAGEGLAAAHAAGLVHRDFKPDNVLLSPDGRQRVTDFGLVRSAARDEAAAASDASDVAAESPVEGALTHGSALLGTPAYMPPEQLDHRADARSDQFSFCASLYQALYRELPFAGARLGSYFAAVARGEVRPAPPGSSVPPSLRAVILRGLRADPEARHPSMRALLDALVAAAAPRRRLASSAAVVLAAAAVGLAFAGWRVLRPSRRFVTDPAPVRQRQITFSGDVWQAALSRDGKTAAYVAGGTLYFHDLARDTRRAITDDDAASFFWAPDGETLYVFLVQVDHATGENGWHRVRPSDGVLEPAHALRGTFALSPDGAEVAHVDERRIRFTDGGGSVSRGELRLKGDYESIDDLEYAPAGDRLLAVTSTHGHTTVWLVRRNGADQRALAIDGVDDIHFAGDGRSILYLRRGDDEQTDDLCVAALAANDLQLVGEPRLVVSGLRLSMREAYDRPRFSLSGDGRTLMYVNAHSWESNLWAATIGADGAIATQQLTADTAAKRTPAVSPDGSEVAFITSNGNVCDVYTMPFAGGARRHVAHVEAQCGRPAWAPDGRQLAFRVPRLQELWIASFDGSEPRRVQLRDASDNDTALFWAPLARILYHRHGNHLFHSYDPASGADEPLTRGGQGWYFNPIASPDQSMVAMAWNRAPGFGLWSVSLRDRTERLLAATPRLMQPIAFSADGNDVIVEHVGYADHTQRMRFWRVPRTGGTLEPWRTLPFAGDSDCSFAVGARRAVCAVPLRQSDVWIIDNVAQLVAGVVQ